MEKFANLFLIALFLLKAASAYGDSLQNSLVEVSSVYTNQNKSINKVKLTGVGLFFNVPILEENRFRYFVATTSHLSQGDITNSLEIWGGEFDSLGKRFPKKEKLKVLGRQSDSYHDLEVIEVEKPRQILPYFQYSPRARMICAPNFQRNEKEYVSIDGIKNTNLIIPDFQGKLQESLAFHKGPSDDEWAYHSMRSVISSFFGQSIFSAARMNEILETGEFVIENPAMGGMSGLPILAELANQGTGRMMIEGHDLFCVFGFIKGYHRIAPKSYASAVALVGKLVEGYLEKPDLKDSVQWKMKSGLTYRIFDREKNVEEISPSYGPSGSLQAFDGGSGASVDGGSGASVDGGHSNALGFDRDQFSNQLEPGMREGNETVLAYVGGPFALFASPLSRDFVKWGKIESPLSPLKFRDSSESLRSLMQKRLLQSAKLFPQEQELWKTHYKALIEEIELDETFAAKENEIINKAPEEERPIMKMFAHADRVKSKFPVFAKKSKEALLAESFEPACYLSVPEEPVKPIKVRVLFSIDKKGARHYAKFFVDQYGRNVDESGIRMNNAPLFYPQDMILGDPGEKVLVDTKGLFFMDFENALGTFYISNDLGSKVISESQEYYRLLGVDSTSDPEDIADSIDLTELSNYRSAKRVEQYARFSISPIPFTSGLWTKNMEHLMMFPQSPLLNYLSQVSHLVMYTKAGFGWPITCVPETQE